MARRLTQEDYDLLAEQQGYNCAICGHRPAEGERALAVDHDHITGVVRGLLCTRCNIGLGYFRDDTARLERAAAYLREHATQPLPPDEQFGLMDMCHDHCALKGLLHCVLPRYIDVPQTGMVKANYCCPICHRTWSCWWAREFVRTGYRCPCEQEREEIRSLVAAGDVYRSGNANPITVS